MVSGRLKSAAEVILKSDHLSTSQVQDLVVGFQNPMLVMQGWLAPTQHHCSPKSQLPSANTLTRHKAGCCCH